MIVMERPGAGVRNRALPANTDLPGLVSAGGIRVLFLGVSLARSLICWMLYWLGSAYNASLADAFILDISWPG